MPHKAFLKKKSLLDRFKDDHKATGYIQSARAEHTWNNPLTRYKRTKELNGWIKSFAGKNHIHKLARFNAMQAGKYEDFADGVKCLRYGSSFELPDGKIITSLDKAIRCRRSGAFTVYITGWVENGSNDPSGAKYTVFFDSGKFSDYFLTDNIQDLPNYQTNGPIPSDNEVIRKYSMKNETFEDASYAPYNLCFTFNIPDDLSDRVIELAKDDSNVFARVYDGSTDIFVNTNEDLVKFLIEGSFTADETDKIIDKFRYATVDCYRSRIKPEEIKSWADKWGVRTNAREYMNFHGPDTVTEVTLYKNFEDVLMTLGDCGF